MKTYTLYEILRDGLMKGKDGQPYKTYVTIRKHVERAGIKPIIGEDGNRCFAITEEQLAELNIKKSLK